MIRISRPAIGTTLVVACLALLSGRASAQQHFPAPAGQQQPYGSQQQPYGSQQQPYGSQQQPYGSQQQPYGSQQQPYGSQQQPGANPYGRQPQQQPGNPYGGQPGGQSFNGMPQRPGPNGGGQPFAGQPQQPGNPWGGPRPGGGQDPRAAMLDRMAQIERQNMGVAPTNQLHSGSMEGPTPNQIPGGQMITTKGLLSLMQRNDVRFAVIDVLGDSQRIPNAISAVPASEAGTFNDQIQQRVATFLQGLTSGKRDMPLVFYCAGPTCWMSYNAALRAIHLGYQNVLWYRGGLQAWTTLRLPTQPQQRPVGPAAATARRPVLRQWWRRPVSIARPCRAITCARRASDSPTAHRRCAPRGGTGSPRRWGWWRRRQPEHRAHARVGGSHGAAATERTLQPGNGRPAGQRQSRPRARLRKACITGPR